ncbi:hypothetical protein OQA88_3105 [Cercophora sp. LCS_1]
MIQSLVRATAPSRCLLRPTVCLRTLTTEAATAAQTTPPAAKPRAKGPYIVSRTPSLQFPVYHLAKSGGNRKLTVLKKVEGDKRTLSRILAKDLGLKEEDVRVKVPTGHIEVKGHHKGRVEAWLEEQGF